MGNLPPERALRRAFHRLHVGALMALVPLAAAFIVFHILWGLLVAGLLFPVLPARASGALVQFWSRIVLAALGIRLVLRPAPDAAPIAATRGALLVINHTSWADVFVVAAVTPARFVAKAEIAAWPLLGRFAAAVGTVFVERGRRHAVARVNHTVAARLRAGQSIGIFPEGTTSDGSLLLRFHANLVQSALDAPAPVIPVGLQYLQDGRPSGAAAYFGDMNLFASIWRILTAPRLTVHLHWLPAVDCAGLSRQAIAGRARAAIGAAVGLPAEEDAVEATPDGATGGTEPGLGSLTASAAP
jgi:1-acyl-sn-glycerol-3-phosphate acyltransferase